MHGRSYKNRCWECLCKSGAENANKMDPGIAVTSKSEPLLDVFEGSGGAYCERAFVAGGSGEPVGPPKPTKMHGRSYKNRCWTCLCKSFAQKLHKMEPGSAVRSNCEPLLSVFEGSGVPSANEDSSTGKSGEPVGWPKP